MSDVYVNRGVFSSRRVYVHVQVQRAAQGGIIQYGNMAKGMTFVMYKLLLVAQKKT